MVRFVRTLQHRVTATGSDFYALSIPPQVAEALGLKAGGRIAIEVRPLKRGKSEIVLKALSQDDAPDLLCIVPTPDGYFDLEERSMHLANVVTRGPSDTLDHQATRHNLETLLIGARLL